MPKNLYMINSKIISRNKMRKWRSNMIIGIENLKEKQKDKEDSE